MSGERIVKSVSTNNNVSLLFSRIEMLTDGVDWWHLSRGLGIHHPERLVKVSQKSGVAAPIIPMLHQYWSFTDEMSLHWLIFTSSLKLSQIHSMLNKLSLSWQRRVKFNLSLILSSR